MGAAVEIRRFQERDLDAVVELSLRAWEPVFARLHDPDWRTVQADAVRSGCTSGNYDVFVAVADGRPVGFATVALNAFHERMGVVDMVAVDPPYQRRGIATLLMDCSLEHMRGQGMDIAAVGTGGDPGHGPARALYDVLGFTPLPGVRYLKLLD